MRGEPLLSAIVAGLGSGFFMGTVFVGAAALMLPTLQRYPPRFLRFILQYTTLAAVFLPLAGVSLFLWGLLGAGAGVLYRWINLTYPGSGWGSPNLPFTRGVLILCAVLSLTLLLTQRRGRGEGITVMVALAAIFGWILPLLAD